MADKQGSGGSRPSKILLDELYASEDDSFLNCFVQFNSYPLLKQFSGQWIEDKRPWARQQMIKYLHLVPNHPGHEVVVKRTLKWALEKGDDELLAHFMVMLDGIVRRTRSKQYRYDYRTRRGHEREYLLARPNKSVIEQTGRVHEYTIRGKTYRMPLPDIRNRKGNRLFSQQTRAHLRRRVWRYFRFVAYQDSQRYVESMTVALARYEDSFFRSGEAILDNWSLMHACFFHAPEITFTASHTNIVRGHSLATMKASPYLPDLWKGDPCARKLWNLLAVARSQFVRMWTIEMLQMRHADWLTNVSIEELIQLLSSGDATVGEFAVELFRRHKSLAHVEIPTWLRLLDEADFSVLPVICEAMQQHIDPSRLGDEQLVELTMARPVAVAKLGLSWLQTRHQQRPLAAQQLCRLSAAGCQWEAEAIADWAIAEIAKPNQYTPEHLVEFFDSYSPAVRRSACRWLNDKTPDDNPQDSDSSQSAHRDPRLWLKLIESPYDEVKFALMQRMQGIIDEAPAGDAATWSTDQYLRVLSAIVLCVNRGSRAKPKAIGQLASLAIQEVRHADVAIQVLAIAARSIRDPERAAGLSALAMIAEQRPDLSKKVAGALPEWTWEMQSETTLSGNAANNKGGSS